MLMRDTREREMPIQREGEGERGEENAIKEGQWVRGNENLMLEEKIDMNKVKDWENKWGKQIEIRWRRDQGSERQMRREEGEVA